MFSRPHTITDGTAVWTARPMPFARRVVFAACAIGAGIVAAMLLLEMVLRVSGRAAHLYTDAGAFAMADDGTYWRNRPGFEGWVLGPTYARIGANGARRDAGDDAAIPDAVRVAIFGDSVTFGTGVEENATFAARLGQRLRAEGLPVRVFNFGVPGHSWTMELAQLRDVVATLDPDVVVLSPIADDLRRDGGAHVDRFGYLTAADFGAPSYWGDIGRATLRHSHLALLLKDELLRARARREAAGFAAAAPPLVDAELERWRAGLRLASEYAGGRPVIVALLDTQETELTRRLGEISVTEFPALAYVHAPPAFISLPPDGLRVPRDGHPSAAAHSIYADLLTLPVATAVRRALETSRRARRESS